MSLTNNITAIPVSNCSGVTCVTDDVVTYVYPKDKDGGILNDATFRVVEKVLDCGGRPVFFFVGAPTNLLNMIIFFRQGLRDRMNLCLFSLAFVDLMYVTSKFIMASYCFVNEEDFKLREVWKYTVREHVVNFVFGFLYCSGSFTMIIAVERCVCVVYPMKALTIMKTRTMGILIGFTVIFLNALCSVYGLKYDMIVSDDVSMGQFVVMLTASHYYKKHKIIIDIIENIVLSAITFVNFFIVSIATCITVVKLRNAMTWRQQTGTITSAERRQMMLVKMLVILSCIYIICTAPTICVALARLLVSDFWTQSRYRRMYFVTHIGATVILMINSSVNFFVYVTQSSRFRTELWAFFFGKKTKSLSTPSNSQMVHCPSGKRA